ncbi:MAG: ImcF-related family protein [Bryobacteraceae bacterium]
MSPILLVIICLLVWIGISVGLAFLMGLSGSMFYIFIGILSVVGIIGAGLYLWLRSKQPAKPGANSGDPEIDALCKDVDSKLAVAKAVPGAKINNLPLVFLMGENGSVKTTTILNSGLEPELVTGQVYQDTNIIPTRLANVFLARQTLFMDTAGGFMNDGNRWQRLVRRLAPGQLKSVVGAKAQAPRAALVTFDGETFFRQGGNEAATVIARKLNERLVEISAQLGIRVPVYVLFTRMDRTQFFLDFVRNIGNEEALQIFGVTVPILPANAGGIYSEDETRRLTDQYSLLTHSLCDKRLLLLPRETDPAKLPGAYEFAREFTKLRRPLVQFLVDLCKPSQLRTSPFLRGFYFSGVRPIVVDDSAGLQAARQQHQPAIDPGSAGATKIFRMGPGGTMAQQNPSFTPQVGATRKVPQWTFLGRLFNDVILADHEAQVASSSSTKTSMAQRILLGAAAALSLLALAGFTVSYFGNRGLENNALEAARGISSVNNTDPKALPDKASLEKLETLRQTLETLDGYKTAGAPYKLRMGLYSGNEMYPHVKEIWCQKFNQTLLGPTHGGLQRLLKGLPSAPQPTDDYGAYFSALRTYLTITVYPDKSTRDTTAAALFNAWSSGRDVGDRAQLARAQFDFYSDYLRNSGGCPLAFDDAAVTSGRRFLAGFSGVASIYQSMLASANKANKPVNYNRDIKGSETIIVNNKDVAGGFTKEGFGTMSEYIKKPDPFFGGEPWVLCGDLANQRDTARTNCASGVGNIDRASLAKSLTDLYTTDYIRAWRGYLRNSTFVKYKDLEDATTKLDQIVSNDTPLMALFWLATRNTAVDNEKIRNAFQPIMEVVPPPATVQKYIYAEKNGVYIDSLAKLQKALADAVPNLATDPNAANKPIDAASDSRMQLKAVARSFNPDPDGQVDRLSSQILEDPIVQVDRFLKGRGKDELNAKGAGLCNQRFAGLRGKFPFNPAAKPEATLDDVVKVFHPTEGSIWTFLEADLKKYMKKEGGKWAGLNADNIQINPAFVAFVNQAQRFSDLVFPGGAKEPKMTYTLTPLRSDVITGSTLTIDGQTQQFGASGGGKQFTWPGAAQKGVRGSVKLVGGSPLDVDDQPGLWGIYRFIYAADIVTPTGGGLSSEWFGRQGRAGTKMISDGKVVSYKFEVNVPVFSKEFNQALQCVPLVAK